jgi:hypothetical protein
MKGGYALDMKSTGFGLVELGYHATAAYAEPLTDDLYLVLDDVNQPTADGLPVPSDPPVPTGVTIFKFNAAADAMPYRWRSKLYVLPKPGAFLWVQIKAAALSNTIFRLYRQNMSAGSWSDTLVREVVPNANEPFNLPMAADYDRCWWEIIGTDYIQSVQIAEDVEELT